MSRVLVAVLSVAALVAAGCVTPGSEVDAQSGAGSVAANWWENAVPSTLTHPDHDHGDRAMHAGLTTPNFQVLGWDPLVTQTFGTSLTGMGCGGAVDREDGRRLAVVHSISTTVSFVVADVTDPAAPKMLGEFYLPNAVVWDADISADGNHVLIGAYPPGPLFGRDVTLPGVPQPGAPSWTHGRLGMVLFRNACTGEVVETGPANFLPGPAIVMVGIQEPENPVFETYVPQPVIGPHSVGSQMIDGVQYATSSVTNLQHEASYYTIFEISGGNLVPKWLIETPGHPGATALNGHTDVFLEKHLVTGQLLAHLANWDAYYVFDLGGPVPTQIATALAEGSIHTTYPLPVMWGDKHYTLVGQEVGEPVDLPSGWIYIVDTTDPANPVEVGRWTLPVKPKWDDGGLQFSPHYVAVQNTTMFVSNYHGGLWAVDISDPASPAAIGIFVPDRDSTAPYGDGTYGPGIEDVIVHPDGVLTTWDNAGGVYLLRFDAAMPSVRAPAWVA